MLSVLILTFNEESNISDCIESLPWRSDLHVLDSGSTDGTREIAISLGAIVIERAFKNYADQRNFGLQLPFSNEWIVMLDADERMTPELAVEIEQAVMSNIDDAAMMLVRRKDIFMNRWLRRSSGYPTWFTRVVRSGRVSVLREVNERYEAKGRSVQLHEHILHFPFIKGIDWWFERHMRYSTMEAQLILADAHGDRATVLDLLSSDPLKRRRAAKFFANRLPGRPFLVFFYLYIFRFGFLDGVAGYTFASMRMSYEVMMDSKVAVERGRQGAVSANQRSDRDG
jgi:glycosyltransferase involved in cell wall biosynthesis